MRRSRRASTIGHLTYLVTERGKPYVVESFGNQFHDWCKDADLVGCSAHGIRKFDATEASENGATTHQLMAMFGWDNITQAELYTRKANQGKLARGGMHLLVGEQQERTADESVPLSSNARKSGTPRR